MVAIEKSIDTFYQENEKSYNIIEGSDEHLDLILSITKPLDDISLKFAKLNETLYSDLQKCSEAELRDTYMPKLKMINKSCYSLVGAIIKSSIYRDVRTSLKNYTKQHDLFREIINDLNNFVLNKDDDLDNLLKQINEL